MNPRNKAVMWLGVTSLLSLVFVFLKRELHFVQMPGTGVVITIGLGVLALIAGWRGIRALTVLAAAGFLTAAVGQVILQTAGHSLADGSNGSTFGLWLGLGAGLLALGLTPQPGAQHPNDDGPMTTLVDVPGSAGVQR